MSSASLRLLLVFAACSICGALPQRALACSPPSPEYWCTVPTVLPVAGSTIPANAGAIYVLMGGGSLALTDYPALTGSDGSTISLSPEAIPSLGDSVARLRLLAPLVEGVEYRLSGLAATGPCGPAAEPLETSFYVGPPAAVPTHPGVFSVVESHVVAGGSCTASDQSDASFGYVDDPALLPWRALAVARLITDGSAPDGFLSLDRHYGVTWDLSVSCETPLATVRTVSLAVVVPDVFSGETNQVELDMSCNTFESCSVGDSRRPHDRGPTRGTTLLVLAVGFAALWRARRTVSARR
jgi:hypothetical protein